MSRGRTISASLLASVLAFTAVSPATAGSGDFVGGVISGVILKTVIDGGVRTERRRAPRQTVRRVQDPAVTEYWRTVQSALNASGYSVGSVDGIAGRRTRAAVRSFQVSLGAEPSGSLTSDEYSQLMQVAGFAPGPDYTYYNEGGPVDTPDSATPDPAADAALAAFDAPKRVGDAMLDDIAANTSVLGIGIGSPRAEAGAAFADGVGGCKATGAYTACTGGNDIYTDDVAFATAGTDDAAPVYFVTRTLAFNQAVPAEALKAKLSETLQPITDDPDMLLTSSGDCDRSLDGDGAAVISASLRSYARGSEIEALEEVASRCRAFFAVTMDGKNDAVTRVTIRLFDGRMLETIPASQTAAVPASTGASSPGVPDVKF